MSYILLLSKSRQNLDEFDPDRTAYGSYDHRVVWGSYASSDKAALPQQEVLDSRAVLYSESDMSALMDCQYIEEIPSFLKSYAASVPLRLVFRQAYIQFKLAGCVTPVNTYYLFAYAAIVVMRICLTNTSRRFIIRFIHDKDGHKLISFADYFKTRAYAEEI